MLRLKEFLKFFGVLLFLVGEIEVEVMDDGIVSLLRRIKVHLFTLLFPRYTSFQY